jgi:hypothetical protein
VLAAISGRTLCVKCQYSSLGNQQIRQAEQREQLCCVLEQPAVAHLLHLEDVLDDVEGMLDLGSHARFELFELIFDAAELVIRQGATLARPQGDMPLYVGCLVLLARLNTLVARIAQSDTLFSM